MNIKCFFLGHLAFIAGYECFACGSPLPDDILYCPCFSDMSKFARTRGRWLAPVRVCRRCNKTYHWPATGSWKGPCFPPQ